MASKNEDIILEGIKFLGARIFDSFVSDDLKNNIKFVLSIILIILTFYLDKDLLLRKLEFSFLKSAIDALTLVMFHKIHLLNAPGVVGELKSSFTLCRAK